MLSLKIPCPETTSVNILVCFLPDFFLFTHKHLISWWSVFVFYQKSISLSVSFQCLHTMPLCRHAVSLPCWRTSALLPFFLTVIGNTAKNTFAQARGPFLTTALGHFLLAERPHSIFCNAQCLSLLFKCCPQWLPTAIRINSVPLTTRGHPDVTPTCSSALPAPCPSAQHLALALCLFLKHSKAILTSGLLSLLLSDLEPPAPIFSCGWVPPVIQACTRRHSLRTHSPAIVSQPRSSSPIPPNPVSPCGLPPGAISL